MAEGMLATSNDVKYDDRFRGPCTSNKDDVTIRRETDMCLRQSTVHVRLVVGSKVVLMRWSWTECG